MKQKRRRIRLQMLTCFIFLVLFLKKITISLKRQLFRKTFVVEEELNRIDKDDIGNLEDLPRFVFIDEECRNLKIVTDGGEFTRNKY